MRTAVKVMVWFVAIIVLLLVIVQLNYINVRHPAIQNWLSSDGEHITHLCNDQLPQLQPYLNYNESYHERIDSVAFFPSKFVNIRAVYFDDRPRDRHNNASVFLVNIWKNITDNKLIIGCQVGASRAKEFKVKVIGETPLWRVYPQYNIIDHEEVLIDCYDTHSVEGSQAFIYYKTSEVSTVEVAISERPFKKPKTHVKPTSPEGVKYNFTVLTCTKVFGGNAPWFIEWLQYQRTIGIDHVHMDVDDFFFRELTKEKMAYVVQEMKKGFLTVEPWVTWLANGKEVWYHNQGLILEDCGYRFRGTYDFMFVLDTDDFFIPRVPDESKVHYYLDRYFKNNIGSSKMRWVEYFPDTFLEQSSLVKLTDGNVTSLLTNYTHYMQGNRKSVHRTSALIDTATHYAFKMIEGYKIEEISVKDAYIAHVRKSRQPSFYKQLSVEPP